jgi:hypothetical protein
VAATRPLLVDRQQALGREVLAVEGQRRRVVMGRKGFTGRAPNHLWTIGDTIRYQPTGETVKVTATYGASFNIGQDGLAYNYKSWRRGLCRFGK